MLKQISDERRAKELARRIHERAGRRERGTTEQKYLLWDLEYIEEHAEELVDVLASLLDSEVA